MIQDKTFSPLRIGFIGCGNIAQKKHLPALQKRDDVELLGFCDADIHQAESANTAFGGRKSYAVTDPMQIMEDPSLDAVYICTPNHLHAKLSINAMEHNKHVVCEKPMAINFDDAESMVKTSIESKKVLNIAYQNRFSDNAQYLKTLCDAGYLGDVYHLEVLTTRRRGIPNWGGFLDADKQHGGALADIGSHAIDLALWFTDNYEPAYALATTHNHIGKLGSHDNRWGSWDPLKFNLEDSAFGTVVMKNGMNLSIKVAWAINSTMDRDGCISLYGAKAGAEFSSDELHLVTEHYGRLSNIVPMPLAAHRVGKYTPTVPPSSLADRETEYLIRSIRENDPLKGNAYQALKVTQIIHGLYISASTRQPYKFI